MSNQIATSSANELGLLFLTIALAIVFWASSCSSSQQAGDPEPQVNPAPGAVELFAAESDEDAGLPGPDIVTEDGNTTGNIRTYRIPGSSVTFEMITVRGGTFKLGTPEKARDREDDESPQLEVSVDGFLMGRYEVTYDEYSIFQYANRDSDSTAVDGIRMDVDAIARPSPPYEDPAHGMGGNDYPAVGMTQWGALHYAKWLSDKTGEFFRLPTEAEWEYACKTGAADNSASNASSGLSTSAWFDSNSDYRLHQVGQKRANALGIFDLLGNAAEWTLDQYDKGFYAELVSGDRHNPWRLPDRLHPRTVRGGAYDDGLSVLRCSSRQESSINWKKRDPQIPKSFWWNTDSPFVGFRLVRPNEQPDVGEQEAFWQTVLGE